MFKSIGLFLLGLLTIGTSEFPPAVSKSEQATLITTGGIKIHALRTGWVRVKQAHRELNAPDFWALPAVFTSGWADWMPIVIYLVEHPEGVFLVDTGPAEDINSPGYYDCDARNGFFYQQNLRFDLPLGESLLTRLKSLEIPPERIKTVLITHFHADHIGGVAQLPHARFLTGSGNWPTHIGAFTCRLPTDFQPETVRYLPDPVGLITHSAPLTADGRVRVVPLPGHTPGHVGLAVVEKGHFWLMAGDATFDSDQTLRGGITAVSQNLSQARETQAVLKRMLDSGKITLLPAHDPEVFARLTKTQLSQGRVTQKTKRSASIQGRWR